MTSGRQPGNGLPNPTMIRPPSNQDEFEQLLDYFWNRLGAEMHPTARRTARITLSKPAAYHARKALRLVRTPEELVSWAGQWLTGDAWQRARSRIRARRYRERNQLVRASITTETKCVLDERASALGMPLWAYLDALPLDSSTLAELESEAGLGDGMERTLPREPSR